MQRTLILFKQMLYWQRLY